ncbi:MAG: hypothetical protein IKW92_09540 [Firmicutes bacterium]|nr:hypothetical protein [Bacillota bacterium]
MTKNIFAGIIATIACVLVWTASNVPGSTGFGFVAASIGLMAAYVIGQYRYGKNYR